MSTKTRSNKNKSQPTSRSVSPSYDNPIQSNTTTSSLAEFKSSNNDVEYESRLSNLESSMSSIQSTLNQLLALQLQANPLINPHSASSSAVTHTTAEPQAPTSQVNTMEASAISELTNMFKQFMVRTDTVMNTPSNLANQVATMVKSEMQDVKDTVANLVRKRSLSPKVSPRTKVYSRSSSPIEEKLSSDSKPKIPSITNSSNLSPSKPILRMDQNATTIKAENVTVTNTNNFSPVIDSSLASSMSASSTTTPSKPIRSTASIPAAIELKGELPSKPPKLAGGSSPKYDEFIHWLNQINNCIEAIARYRPVLLEPSIGWNEYKRINSKFNPNDLESIYLDAHRTVWAFILSGLDDHIRSIFTSRLENYSKANNLTIKLGFSSIDSTFYKNCYVLLEELKRVYGRNSEFLAVELQQRLSNLSMKLNEDPTEFFREWRTLHMKLNDTIKGYQMPSEEQQIAIILTKLPKELNNSMKPFLIANRCANVDALEMIMRDWYQSNLISSPPVNKSIKQNNPSSTPSTAAAVHGNKTTKQKQPFNKKVNNQQQQVEGHSDRNDVQHIEDILQGSTLVANVVTNSDNTYGVISTSSNENSLQCIENYLEVINSKGNCKDSDKAPTQSLNDDILIGSTLVVNPPTEARRDNRKYNIAFVHAEDSKSIADSTLLDELDDTDPAVVCLAIAKPAVRAYFNYGKLTNLLLNYPKSPND